MHRSTEKFSAVLLLAVFFTALSTAAWNIEVLDEPENRATISNMSDTVRTVNLSKDGSMVNRSELEGDYSDLNFTYRYNATDSAEKLEHLEKGYWYADFNANYTRGRYVEFQLRDEQGSLGIDEINATERINTGNYSIGLKRSVPDRLNPGETFEVRVNVTDLWNDEPEEEADVDVYFTNVTETLEVQDLGNSDGATYYNSGINIPDSRGNKYVMHINATNATVQPDEDTSGSLSRVVETAPPLQGRIDELSTDSGCDNSSFFTECERNASIEAGFNSTGEEAESVNFTVRKYYSDSGEVSNRTWELSEDEGLYNASFDFPVLNTSRYDREVSFVFNASMPEDRLVETYNVTFAPFEVSDASENRVDQGGEFGLRLSPERPFSATVMPLSEFDDVNVSLTYSNGTEFRSLEKSDMQEYEDTGFVGADVQIPTDAPAETYGIDSDITNEYGYERTVSGSFQVEERQTVFDVNSSIDIQLMDLLEHNTSIYVENLKSQKLELEIEPQDELEGITDVNSSVNVSGSSEKWINVSFDPEEVGEIEGDLLLNDTTSDAEEEIDVDLDGQECARINGSLCVDSTEWVNVTSGSTGYESRFVDVNHPRDGNVSVDVVEVSDPSNILTVEPASFELNDTRTLVLNYSVSAPGNFTAELDVSTSDYSLPIRAALDSSAEAPEAAASVPVNLDLGAVTSGNDVTRQITVENTGDYEIYSISANSPTYTVSATNTSIEAGGEQSVSLTFESVTSGSGQVTLTMETSEGALSEAVSASTSLSESETDPTEGVGEDEEDPFADETEEEEGSDSDSAFDESGDEGSTTTPTDGGGQGGNGSMLIFIGAGVFVLLLIGFVFYTSYIPEEGDPLYSVLGEE